MANRDTSGFVRLIAGSIVYLAIVAVAVLMLGGEAWWMLYSVAAVASPFLGAGVVWIIVRRVNRRDDPRPIDPPAPNP